MADADVIPGFFLIASTILFWTRRVHLHMCDGQNSIHVVRPWHRFTRSLHTVPAHFSPTRKHPAAPSRGMGRGLHRTRPA